MSFCIARGESHGYLRWQMDRSRAVEHVDARVGQCDSWIGVEALKKLSTVYEREQFFAPMAMLQSKCAL
jgi:hypothetical protein